MKCCTSVITRIEAAKTLQQQLPQQLQQDTASLPASKKAVERGEKCSEAACQKIFFLLHAAVRYNLLTISAARGRQLKNCYR